MLGNTVPHEAIPHRAWQGLKNLQGTEEADPNAEVDEERLAKLYETSETGRRVLERRRKARAAS